MTGNRRVREGQSVNDVNLSGRCIAVLGMGIMGRSMVRNLARAGAEVVVWNRTIDTARKRAGGAGRGVAFRVEVLGALAEPADHQKSGALPPEREMPDVPPIADR